MRASWDLLAEHARTRPRQAAVRTAEAVTGYGELAELVGERADELRALDFAPGEVLAVQLPDGLPAVVALLAALRARVPFVWLDEAHPVARRDLLLRECRPAAQLSPAGLRRIDRAPGIVPRDAACVLHTSGSTGAPKGIVQRRRNLAQFAGCFAAELGLTPGGRILQWARMTYDAAHAEVLAAVHAGAELVVPAAKSDLPQVADLLAQREVTHLLAVPSLCRELLAARGGAPLPELVLLGLFGEELPVDLLAETACLLPNAAVTNFYGPAECTLATRFRVPAGFSGDRVPIGDALPGREIRLDPVGGEPGVGEILVRTRYLAHGYLHRDRETAQSFLPDPDGEPGVRVYRTGDLGERTDSGELLFRGRIDDQVKIRGVRVQLGEIEAALRSAPEVADAAVRVFGSGIAPRVVAYVCAPAGGADPAALRARLIGVLPAALVPSDFVELDELPRTASGKIDRPALPDPAAGTRCGGPHREQVGAASDEPAGELARELALIWRAVLGRAEVGPDDDFFAVGGHSLLAPLVVAEVRDRLGLVVSQRAVFEHSRFGDFAVHLMTLRQVDVKEERA